MYWFNSINIKKAAFSGGFLLMLCLLAACTSDDRQTEGKPSYFDLKAYFNANAAGLNKTNPAVNKTVTHNRVIETKVVHIGNWGQELNLFIQSDINKPAWKNSYTVKQSANTTVYTAKYPDLKTRAIVINKDGDKIKWILVSNHTKNMLYETTEKLSYFPDSLYIIQKWQKVRLMGLNYYRIEGLLKK